MLNPGEEATLNFSLENTSLDGFAYAINIEMVENENFEILSDDVFIDEGDSAVLHRVSKNQKLIWSYVHNISNKTKTYFIKTKTFFIKLKLFSLKLAILVFF